MTIQQGSVAATVRALPRGVRPAEFWRNAAFTILRLNAKECEALGRVFEDEDVADERRVLVLDLLAGAGTFDAQRVMRRLLALAVARRDRRMFVTFVQRLGFVEQPDGPTLRFLMSVLAESRAEANEIRAACAYALGAAAGQAFRAGDQDAAVRASDVLRRDLLRAGSASEKASLVTALGNVGIPSDASAILRFAGDADATVRAATALALRKIRTPEVKGRLLEMLSDSEQKVAHGALVSLGEHPLLEDDLERLAELVLGGRTALALDARILRLMVTNGGQLQPTGNRPGPIENALRLLLGRVEAQAPIAPTPLASGEHPVVSGAHRMLHRAPQSSAPPPASPADDDEATLMYSPKARTLSSGAYRIAHPDADRLQSLGLNMDARMSNLPAPPARDVVHAIHPAALIRRR